MSAATDSIKEILSMVAMIPEHELTGYAIDPYGRIEDALRCIGVDPVPDAWVALHRWLGFPDPPEETRRSHEM